MSQWQVEQVFPNLPVDGYAITSPATEDYNCFAWAIQETGFRIDPYDQPDGYWPNNLPREPTIDNFIALYGLYGFEPCADGQLEAGVPKIAIYSVTPGLATHAARQLPDGTWTSKLGDLEDIYHHSLQSLSAGYGTVNVYMAKR